MAAPLARSGAPTTAPAVSVIMSCYNLGRYVRDAIESVLAQSRQDFEIVVVNDGSTDEETNRILGALDYPRTTVLATGNRGLPAARNLALAHARGRYVCALDADDRLHPSFFEKTLAVLDSDSGVAFVSTWAECFGLEQWTWRQERCDFPALLAECVVLTAAPVRRSAVEAVGGYDERAYLYGSEDWDLWISLVERGYRGVVLPEVLFQYRQRQGSMRRIAEDPAIRSRVWRTLLEKHRDSYTRHLRDVLLLQEDECGRLLRENRRIEHDLTLHLEPLVEAGRAELAQLEALAGGGPATGSAPAPLAHALAAARAEVDALRSSWSWRVTAPLRGAYDLLLAARRRFVAPKADG